MIEPWMLLPTGGVPTVVMALVWWRIGQIEKKVDNINGTVRSHAVELGQNRVRIEHLERGR